MSTFGSRIRRLRKRQHRTLQDIADNCRFTRSLLSKIENDKTVPPVATLMRIAEALGVKTSVLLDADDDIACVFSPAGEVSEKAMATTDKGYQFHTYAAGFSNKCMQPFLFVARKKDVVKHKLSHTGEEFIYMLEGKMKYRVGAVEYTLRPGDTLYFDAEEEHALEPLSAEVKYLGVFAEPEGRRS